MAAACVGKEKPAVAAGLEEEEMRLRGGRLLVQGGKEGGARERTRKKKRMTASFCI